MQIPEQEDDSFEGGEDSSLEGEENNPPKSAYCYTPSTAQSRVGAPISHTPNLCDYLTTPDLKSGLKRYTVIHTVQREIFTGAKFRGIACYYFRIFFVVLI
jgi:hypothetical protein